MAIGLARLSLCVALLAALAAPAHAVTYSFTGQCTDCFAGIGSATATLILQDYTPGDPIQQSNLVSFSYHGTDLLAPYEVTPETGFISGSIPEALPAFAAVSISLNTQIPGSLNRAFASLLDGEWGIDDDGPDDFGTNGTWSLAVPEPDTFGLTAIGMLALGVARLPRR